jgi:hypothetical protein
MDIPETPFVLKVPVQFTSPPRGRPEDGTGTARPLRKISSSPVTGTVVIQVLVIALNVVELQVADGEKMICAFGAELVNEPPFPIAVIVESVNVIVAPAFGIPFALKLALNQTQLPELMGVPLKFDAIADSVVQGGGGGTPQLRLLGEKWMLTVLTSPLYPGIVAVPEKVKLPFKAANEPVTVPLNVVEVAVNGIEPVTGNPLAYGELSIV